MWDELWEILKPDKDTFIVGDFNAKHPEWNCNYADTAEQIPIEHHPTWIYS